MENKEAKKILYQQLELLAERSKVTDDLELAEISVAMCEIAKTIAHQAIASTLERRDETNVVNVYHSGTRNRVFPVQLEGFDPSEVEEFIANLNQALGE